MVIFLYNSLMDQEQKKGLSNIFSLKRKVEKLRKEVDLLEVRPIINKKIKKIDTNGKILGVIIKIASKTELKLKDKKELMRLTRQRLISLKEHFLSIYDLIQKNPTMVLDRKIKSTEKDLKERVTTYEKVIPLLFRKKEKKK